VREVSFKLLGEEFTLSAVSGSADRLVEACKRGSQKRFEIKRAKETLERAGVTSDDLTALVSSLHLFEINGISVETPGQINHLPPGILPGGA